MADRRPSGEHADRCKSIAKILIPALREVARRHGYALAVHGSLRYDIDLIACPWTTSATSAQSLSESIKKAIEAIAGFAFDPDLDGHVKKKDKWHIRFTKEGKPGNKPHGRLTWVFHLGGGPYVDLSVMPRLEA